MIFYLLTLVISVVLAYECPVEDSFKPYCQHIVNNKQYAFDVEKHVKTELSRRYPLPRDNDGNSYLRFPVSQGVLQVLAPLVVSELYKHGIIFPHEVRINSYQHESLFVICKRPGCESKPTPQPIPGTNIITEPEADPVVEEVDISATK